MNTCGFDAALLDLFLDGALSPEEMETVQAHLHTCPECQSYVDDVLTMRDFFPDAEEVDLPENFAAGVMAEVAKAPQSRPRKQPWGKLAVAAACLALIVLLQRFDLPMGMGAKSAAPQEAPAACIAASSGLDTPAEAAPESESQRSEDALDTATEPAVGYNLMPNEAQKANDREHEILVTATEEQLDGLLETLTPVEVRPGYACYLLDAGDTIVAELIDRDLLQDMPAAGDTIRLEIRSE